MGIGPWPETFTKTTADRFDEWLVGMGLKKLFKSVDEDRCDNIKEVLVLIDCVRDDWVR